MKIRVTSTSNLISFLKKLKVVDKSVLLELTEDKPSILNFNKKSDLLFPSDKMQMQYLKPSVLQRFNEEEIYIIIRRTFDKFHLKNYQFEFAITSNSLTGQQMLSNNYYALYADSASGKNTSFVIPLEPSSGSNFENLVGEELLNVIVPHRNSMILKEMFWFIRDIVF